MERIIFIYTLIFIILISIFIYGFQMKNNYQDEENNNEKFNPINSQKNTPTFVKKFLNKRVSSDPNYRVENINQFNYDRLYEKLQGVNEEKVELKGKNQKIPPPPFFFFSCTNFRQQISKRPPPGGRGGCFEFDGMIYLYLYRYIYH